MKKSSISKEKMEEKLTEFPYVSSERMQEIYEVFRVLGINCNEPYDGLKNFQQVGILRYEGVTFHTSDSSLSPFKTSE